MSYSSLIKSLPETLRQPTWLAVLASLGVHGLLAIALPILPSSSRTLDDAQRTVQLLELTPEEQSRLPDFSIPQYSFPPGTAQPDQFSLSPQAPQPPLQLLPGLPPTYVPPAPPPFYIPPTTYQFPQQPLPQQPLPQQPRSGAPAPSRRPTQIPAEQPNQQNQQAAQPNQPNEGRRENPEFSGEVARARDLEGLSPAQAPNNPTSEPQQTPSQQAAAPPLTPEQRTARLQQELLARYRYDPSGTSQGEATSRVGTWLEEIKQVSGNPELVPGAPIQETIASPVRACLPQEPGIAAIGVLVTPEGEVQTDWIRKTGYPALDEAADEFAKGYGFPKADEYKAYQLAISFDYNTEPCLAVPTQPPEG